MNEYVRVESWVMTRLTGLTEKEGTDLMDLLPISLINVARCRYNKGAHHLRHRHNFYHLIYFTGGQGSLWIGDQEQFVAEHQLFVIAPGIYHEYINDWHDPLRTIEVKFLLHDEQLCVRLSALPERIDLREHYETRLQLEQLLYEAQNQALYYKEHMTIILLHVLLQLLRIQGLSIHNGNHPAVAEKVEETLLSPSIVTSHQDETEPATAILRYIEQHYQMRLTLSDLAKHFTMSRTYLCDVFSKKYGVSPIQFLNLTRLYHAKHLLANSELSITDVSERTGFPNLHHFSKYFRSKEGISPAQYRQLHFGCMYIKVDESMRMVDGMLERQDSKL